jgi:hypothetical protein
VHILEWLHAQNLLDVRLSTRAIKFAIERGHMNVLKWFYQHVSVEPSNKPLFVSSWGLYSAMGHGHVNVVMWMLTLQPHLGIQRTWEIF